MRGCVSNLCAHKYTVLLCFCICVHKRAALFWAFFSSSLNRWGWAPSLSSSLPIQPRPLLGTCHSLILEMVHLRRLGSSCRPSAPSPSYLRNGPGSRKTVTEQRLIGGREKPVKTDSTHWLTELGLRQGQASDVWSGTQSWDPPPPLMYPPCWGLGWIWDMCL